METPIFRTIVAWMAIGLAGAGSVSASSPESSSTASSFAAPHRALLDRYCVTCHNQKLKTAGLMLDQMDV